jgi:protein TonB
MIRIALIVFPALAITLGLFALMMVILQQDDVVMINESRVLAAEFLMPERKIETRRQIDKPDKPDISPQPKVDMLPIPKISLAATPTMQKIAAPVFQPNIKISLTMPQGGGDSEYLPILKVAPLYPPRASQRNLEGYVIVEYTVTRDGSVRDVRVIDAKPASVFNQAAIEAARKFKYRPRRIGDEYVEVPGVRNRFNFRLEK